MTLRAVGDKIVVRVSTPEETTPSGLIVPATARSQGNEGVITSKGKDVTFGRKGSVVVFLPTAGVPVKDGDVEYRVLQAKDVLCLRVQEHASVDAVDPDHEAGQEPLIEDSDEDDSPQGLTGLGYLSYAPRKMD